ncbi:helicase [Bifidobacterium phasiani]|uniref:Helicase n=1 Tax=Bifidobacterium phasiani TaxID=2834431 RepID=A0ABS6W8Q0_9BIFI|nr:helicase [Bifidobacterium phasiani]MBW3082881.1 helicase [Bifidobacterium phasiani]
MAEGNNHSSQGGRSYGGRKPGSGRPGNRGGKGFRPRGNGGRSFGGNGYKPRRHDGPHAAGGEGEQRNRDGERRYNGGNRGSGNGGNRGNRSFHHGNGQGNRSGFRRNGGYRDRDERRDENQRTHGDFHGERRDHGDGGFRGGRRDDGFRRNGHGGHGGYNGRSDRGNGRRDSYGERRDFRNDRRHDGERREFTAEEKREYREAKRGEYMAAPRRNSDGTMSFPSQNPYTHRRPGEPKMPKGMEWSMLSKDERERLRGLSKEHAENIGLHILAAFSLEESDPQAALEHAKWAAHQASRIDFARETLAFVAYRQGDYKLAMREFRTAYRMNGYPDYLPFIADCERGTGNPKKAIELAMSDDVRRLRGEAKAEMMLVYAGALGDLKHWDKAVEIVHLLGRSKGLSGAYRMRAIQAEQYFLEEAGRTDEAAALDGILERLELQYADMDEDETSEDVVIDYDLQDISEDLMEELGITEDDARFAPADESDEDGGTPGDGAGDARSDSSDSDADSGDGSADGEPYTVEDEVHDILVEAGIDEDSSSDDAESSETDAAGEPAEAAEEPAPEPSAESGETPAAETAEASDAAEAAQPEETAAGE